MKGEIAGSATGVFVTERDVYFVELGFLDLKIEPVPSMII